MTSVRRRFSEASVVRRMCSGRLSSPAGLLLGIECEAELRRDDDAVTDGSEGLAHQVLVGERSVDLRGVEEGDSAVHGSAQHRDHLRAVPGRPVAEAHAHAAEADGRDFELALPERAFLHRCLPLHPPTIGDGTPPD